MSLYRIHTVSEKLGVPAATLRAWERRYSVPLPSRTASSYRLYSDADVQVIKAMRDLVHRGVAPAEAALQVRSTRDLQAAAPLHAPPEVHDPYAALVERIVAATTAFDPDELALEVSRALTLGPALTIFDRTIGPALARIGELWHDGEITIAHEHFASELIGGALVDLVRLAQPADSSRRVALACFADEDHQLPLYGVALRFASWGFRSVILGARTPPDALASAVDGLEPDLVALSTTIALERARAHELVGAYADACRGTAWIVGGAAAHGLRPWVEQLGGVIADTSSSKLRTQVERAIAGHRRAAANS